MATTYTKEQIQALRNEPLKLEFVDTDGDSQSVIYTDCDTVEVLDDDLNDDSYTDAEVVGLWMKNDDYYEIDMNATNNKTLIWDLFQTM